MADGYIQTPTEGTGKKVDAEAVTTSTGDTVYQLRMSVPDGMRISGDILKMIYREMKITNKLLAEGFGIREINQRQGDFI